MCWIPKFSPEPLKMFYNIERRSSLLLVEILVNWVAWWKKFLRPNCWSNGQLTLPVAVKVWLVRPQPPELPKRQKYIFLHFRVHRKKGDLWSSVWRHKMPFRRHRREIKSLLAWASIITASPRDGSCHKWHSHFRWCYLATGALLLQV